MTSYSFIFVRSKLTLSTSLKVRFIPLPSTFVVSKSAEVDCIVLFLFLQTESDFELVKKVFQWMVMKSFGILFHFAEEEDE